MPMFQITEAKNCMVLQSTSIYGGQRHTFDQNSCFEVDDLNELIVHTQSNVVGFTLNFKNGTIQSILESSDITNKSRFNLLTSDLIGGKVYFGEGV